MVLYYKSVELNFFLSKGKVLVNLEQIERELPQGDQII